MTDHSQLVLLWEIDNAKARFATGKVESDVFYEGGFRWTAELAKRVENSPFDEVDFGFRCGVDHNGPWKCEVKLEVFLQGMFWACYTLGKKIFSFNEEKPLWLVKDNALFWSDFSVSQFEPNNKFTVKIHINIMNCDRGQPIADPAKFAVPNSRSDVILKIGEKKLHVSKELLAIHSPFFEALFFGDFIEKGKDEVEIKDVAYEEFLDLLYLIYPGAVKLIDRTVLHILKLADRFQMKGVMDQAEKYLMELTGFKDKLFIADEFRLEKLREHSLQSVSTSQEMFRFLKSSVTSDYSDELKLAIFDRLMKII